jgi:hypothetical protein
MQVIKKLNQSNIIYVAFIVNFANIIRLQMNCKCNFYKINYDRITSNT